MSVLLAMAVPAWESVVRREQEEELIFRGEAIAAAIDCYAVKFPGVPLQTLDALVEQKCLRRTYTEPMDPEQGWRFLYTTLPPGAAAFGAMLNRTDLVLVEDIDPQQTPGARLIGVATHKDKEGFRSYKGKTAYKDWLFMSAGFTKPGNVPGAGAPAVGGPVEAQPGLPPGPPNPAGGPAADQPPAGQPPFNPFLKQPPPPPGGNPNSG